MLSYIIPVFIDNNQREENIRNCINYYSNLLDKHIESEIILVEESDKPILPTLNILDNPKIKYIYFKSVDSYRKTLSYNYGARLALGDIYCFLDADVFVNPNALITIIEQIRVTPGVSLGYNGVAIYTTQTGKTPIVNKVIENWDNIKTCIDLNNLTTNYSTKDYLIGNTKAVGGCLICDKQSFYNIGGFNPNFTGWGYEDNEIISRARILETPLFKPNNIEDVLIHAWHDIENKDKSKHKFYSNNESEVRKVESMDKNQLKEYIKTWNV